MKKIFKILLVLFFGVFSYAQEISWENVRSNYDKVLFKTNSQLIKQKLNNTTNSITSKILIPIDDFNLQQFEMKRESETTPNDENPILFSGISKNKKDKVFLNVIGEIITITIIQKNKRLHLSNIKNKNEFILKEIDTSDELENIKLDDCSADHDHSAHSSEKKNSISNNLDPVGKTPNLVKYRIAISPTAEWSNYYIDLYDAQDLGIENKKALVTSELNIAISELNKISGRDLSILFELIPQNDKLIVFDTNLDGFTHGNKSAQLGENITKLNNTIGFNSFDIGHVFDSYNYGGVAYVYQICSALKAGGVTGGVNGTGFYFVFAHEVGHQLGAWHTFNTDSRDGVEIGSGVTIMAYGPRNEENLYYHAKSIKAITSNITAKNCGQNVEGFSNTVPYYSDSPNSYVYNVPTGTPLLLGNDFEILDNEQSEILFNWDQVDRELGVNPPINTSTQGPMFISQFPTTNKLRYLPSLETVLEGSTQNELEVIPRLSRSMNFTLTARDNKLGGGAVMQEDFIINFNRSEFGPFRIFSQNTNGLSVNQNDEIEIKWNHQAAPNTDFVDIDISYDGGNTFTYNLAKNSPNDGTETVIVPDYNKSENARIRVKATDNIFYAINAANFTVLDPSFKLNLTNPPTTKCFGETSQILINPTGGAGAPYDILWEQLNENSEWVEYNDQDNNPKTLSDILPGNFRVIVFDKENISYISPTIVVNGPKEMLKFDTTYSNIDLSCFGDNNGKIEVTPSGGTFPYTLLLNNNVVTNGLKENEIYSINDLNAGVYSLKLIDANGCFSKETSFEVSQPESELSLENFDIKNSDDENGSITIEIKGGSAEYEYYWTGPNNYSSGNKNIDKLIPGTYNLKVTDRNGCEYFNEFVVEEEGDFNYNLSVTNILCAGSDTGSIKANPNGGNGGPFNFKWYNESDELISTNSEVKNLSKGLYKLKITDSLNEEFPLKEILIKEPSNPIQLLITDKVNLDCKGDENGKFDINISGGNAPYKYFLNGQVIQSNIGVSGTNEKIIIQDNLKSGVYKVEIQDSNGCSSTVQTIISEPEFEITLKSNTITNVSKFNLNDGSIEIEVEGGTISNQEGYSYSWTGPDNFNSSLKNIYNLKPGTYNLKISDINNCSIEKNFEVKSPITFTFNNFISNSPTCYDGIDGKISFNYSGGYGSPYKVKWTKKINSEFVSVDDQSPNDNTLEDISSGTYKVEVIDSRNISYSYENEIVVDSVNEFLIKSVSNVINETCPGSEDGQFSVSISGGTAPYNYYFDNQLIATNRGDSTNTDQYTVENLSKKEYTFYAVDSNGCVTSPVIIKIDGDDPIEIVNEDFAVTNISCVNGDDGSIELVVQGGDYSGNFTYEWTGPNGYSATTKNIGNLSDSGTYTVKITQGNCSLIKDFELIEPGKLTATVSNIVHSQCGGDGGFQLDITGGTAPWTVWGYTYGAKGQESITLYYNKLSAGIKNFTVTDANSCSTVNLNPEILGSSKNLQFDVEETVSCDSSVNNEIKVTLSGGDFFLDGSAEYYKLNISGPNKNEDINVLEGVQYSFKNLEDGNYTFRVTERDFSSPNDSSSNGCTTEKSIYVSSSIEWSGTSSSNISCVDQNNTPSNDGSKVYNNLSGGTAFVDNSGQEYYEYILDFNGTTLHNGTINKSQNLSFKDLAAGSYKLTLNDDNSCSTEDFFEITQPSKLVSTIKKVTDACYNPQVSNQKGKVDFLIKDGTAPYQLFLIDSNNNTIDTGESGGDSIGQNTVGWESSLTNLNPGTYSLKFIDSNQCEITSESFTIESSDEFIVEDINITDISCSGAEDGILEIGSIKGGKLPYRVIVESSNNFIEKILYDETTDLIFNDLEYGEYSLKIEDSEGICAIYLQDFEILEPSSILITTLNTDNQKCFDYNDGLIEIEVSGGLKIGETVDYNLKWYKNDQYVPGYDDLLKIQNLEAANYRVEVDAIRTVGGVQISCSSNSASYEITKPQRLYASENLEQHVDINCNSEANGQFEIYFSGGKSPYKIISNGGVVAEGLTNNTFLFSEMMAGTYNIDILDANNCKFSEAINPNTQDPYGLIKVELLQPEKTLEIETSFINTTCSGSNDGEIEIFVSGGRAPYNIDWVTDVSYKIIESDIEEGYFKILSSPGLITATVSDSTNNCGSLSSVINIKQPDELLIEELSTKNNLCFTDSDGEYELYVSGLTNEEALTDYNLKWYKFVNGNYEIIENPNVTQVGSNFKAKNLTNGEYKVDVVRKQFRNFKDGDVIECSISKTFSILSPDELSIQQVNLNNISCERPDGDFKFKINGGQGPFNLLFDEKLLKNIELNSLNEYTIGNLEIGNYDITVFDSNNCVSNEFNFEIKEITPNYDFIIENLDTNNNGIIEGNNPECFNGLGSFYFEIENNLSSEPLKFFINESEIFIDNQITLQGDGYLINNLELKKYDFKIIDDQGACYSTEFEILNTEKIRLFDDNISNYIIQKIFCADDQNDSNLNTGIIDLNGDIVGGTPFDDPNFKYKFEWTGPGFSSNQEKIEVNKPGIYNLKIKDKVGCVSEYNFDLSIEEIKSNAIITNLSCENDLGNIIIDPIGGEGPYTFEWYESDVDGNLGKRIGTSMNINNLDVGNYISFITDSNNCTVFEEHQIINEKVFYIDEPEISDPLCFMESGSILLKLANPYSNTFDFTYNGLTLNYSKAFSGSDYDIYQIELENPISDESLIVTNEYGCSVSYELNLGIGEVNFDIEINGVIEDEGVVPRIPITNNMSIINKSIGKYHSIEYDFGDGSDSILYLRDEDQIVSHQYKSEGFYFVNVKIFNEQGCYKELNKTVLVGIGYSFDSPNAFTPNNDGYNDIFRPTISGFIKAEFYIYSRSGLELYKEGPYDFESKINDGLYDEVNNFEFEGWDGKNRDPSEKVYYYMFKGTTLDNEEIIKSNYLTVIN